MSWLRKRIILWALKDCKVGSWGSTVSFPVLSGPSGEKTGENLAYIVFDKSISYGIKVEEQLGRNS